MRTWFTSDTHFGHVRMAEQFRKGKLGDGTLETHDKELIRRWNLTVSPEDLVFHLGDFAMGPKEKWPEYRAALNGRIAFTFGNHDYPLDKFEAALRDSDEVHETLRLLVHGLDISMAHCPVGSYVHHKKNTGEDEIEHCATRLLEDYDIALCGHVHESWLYMRETRCLNVGVDQWDYSPISLEQILAEVLKHEFHG